MSGKQFAAVAGIVGALAGTATQDSRATAASAFYPPGRAVECQLPVNFAEGATTPWRFMCWTPNDGFTVEMSFEGRVRRTSLAQLGMTADYVSGWARRFGVLGFGKDWTCCFDRRGFGHAYYTCASRSNGLTCRNRAGHGWWLGRFKGYRLF